MKLPEKFQYRVHHSPGFTHTAKMLENGDLKVKWARGWDYHITQKTGEKSNAQPIMPRRNVEKFVQDGRWIVIVDKKKPHEDALPDVFYIETKLGNNFKCVRNGVGYNFIRKDGEITLDSPIDVITIKSALIAGSWKIVDKKLLTAEQQRANKDFRERIAALESSIKLNQQDIHHKELLIKNYECQIEDLKAKIVEGDE